MSSDAALLPAVLKIAGYTSTIIGKWHLGLESPNTPNEKGFDYFRGFLGDMMDDYAIIHFQGGYQPEIPNKKQMEIRKVYDTLEKSGIKGLYFQEGKDLIGTDQEGTIDGAHPNDLGLFRYAEVIYPTIKSIIKS